MRYHAYMPSKKFMHVIHIIIQKSLRSYLLAPCFSSGNRKESLRAKSKLRLTPPVMLKNYLLYVLLFLEFPLTMTHACIGYSYFVPIPSPSIAIIPKWLASYSCNFYCINDIYYIAIKGKGYYFYPG